MKRRDFLKMGGIVLPGAGILEAVGIVKPKSGSREWWGGLSKDFTFSDKPAIFVHRFWNCDYKADCFAGTRTMPEVFGKLETDWSKVTCPSCRTIRKVKK